MILAVWGYDFILWRQKKAEKGAAVRHTLWCLAGYAGALVILLNYIHICYGLGNYLEGIRRLFAMTDRATDYKPAAMIMGVVGTYTENLYWVIRIGIIIAGGMLLFALADRIGKRYSQKKMLSGGLCICWVLVSLAMLWWLYDRKFCSLLFYSYDSMLRPGILFLMLTMLIAAFRICSKAASPEEKLLGGMLILIILLTSLGSNNDVYPSLNNLFLAAPYTFWQSWRFLRYTGNRSRGALSAVFPAKGILAAFLALCLFQFAGFGAKFVFAEATGVQETGGTVENNEILKNIRMSPQKALWMEEISAFAEENDLKGQEVILYGNIPSMSYYLQMPSAFNPWSDLDSYGYEVMKKDLKELSGRIREKGKDKPVIIVENAYVLYEEEGIQALEAAGIPESTRQKMAEDLKWTALTEFMENFGYRQTFRNEKFTLYQ